MISRWSKFVSTMVGPGGFVVDSILVRRWIIWMCAEGIYKDGIDHGEDNINARVG